MGRQVVEDDHVAGRQSWRQKLLDIGAEGFAGHGAVEDHRRDDAGRTQARNECRGSPMAEWGSVDQALALGAPAIASSHIGGSAGLIQEHKGTEEHTSELQSLMRITYAVLGLTNK